MYVRGGGEVNLPPPLIFRSISPNLPKLGNLVVRPTRSKVIYKFFDFSDDVIRFS